MPFTSGNFRISFLEKLFYVEKRLMELKISHSTKKRKVELLEGLLGQLESNTISDENLLTLQTEVFGNEKLKIKNKKVTAQNVVSQMGNHVTPIQIQNLNLPLPGTGGFVQVQFGNQIISQNNINNRTNTPTYTAVPNSFHNTSPQKIQIRRSPIQAKKKSIQILNTNSKNIKVLIKK